MSEEKNTKKPFTLFDNETGQSIELPVLKGTEGPDVLDIRNLYKDTGLFTYDPGYTSTTSCNSAIRKCSNSRTLCFDDMLCRNPCL